MEINDELYKKCTEFAEIAKVLSHPARAYIIKKLSTINACCYSGDLFNELPIARSSISQHLKELKYAGLIVGEIEAPFIKYCINPQKWQEVKVVLSAFIEL